MLIVGTKNTDLTTVTLFDQLMVVKSLIIDWSFVTKSTIRVKTKIFRSGRNRSKLTTVKLNILPLVRTTLRNGLWQMNLSVSVNTYTSLTILRYLCLLVHIKSLLFNKWLDRREVRVLVLFLFCEVFILSRL